MTPDSITQQRLHNLHLRDNAVTGVENVIHNLVAVQAQDFAGAKWGVGLRVSGATDAIVEAAFAKGRMLRTHALRPTWHFVTPADIRWLLSLTAPRVLAASASQFRKLELDATVFKRTTRALEKSLKGGHHLTRDELRVIFEREGVNTRGDLRMSYIMMHAELHGIVCSGARNGNQFTYALLDERAPIAAARVPTDSVVELAARYFQSRGPASVHDFAKWSGLTLAACRAGFEGCKSNLSAHTINGKEYWTPDVTVQKYDGEPVAYLMSIYDEYVSSYRDRSAIGTPELGRKLLAMGNALTGIVVIDGKIAAAWKRTLRKQYVDVTISALRRLTKADRAAVSANAEAYAQFIGLTLQLAFSKLEIST